MNIKVERSGFTVLEFIMVILLITIFAITAIPRFIDLRAKACEATNLANIKSLKTARDIYYAKTAMPAYSYLCTASGNPYRNVTVESPCYPASVQELESLLVFPPSWCRGSGGECYNPETGQVTMCQ